MYNLPAYYLLPLIGLNFKNFGSYKTKSNLLSIKLNIKTLKLICRVHKIANVQPKVYEPKSYLGNRETNVIVYKFPESLSLTVEAFSTGKYSKIPSSIKEYIVENCGLPKTHDVLLALQKDSTLREKLEDSLSLKDSLIRLDENAELLSIPKEEWFVSE